jgi:hypothetical protein
VAAASLLSESVTITNKLSSHYDGDWTWKKEKLLWKKETFLDAKPSETKKSRGDTISRQERERERECLPNQAAPTWQKGWQV